MTVFHTGLYGRFIEIQSNLRRKKLHRGSFSKRDNAKALTQFRRESQSQYLKMLKADFSSRTDPSIFTSIV